MFTRIINLPQLLKLRSHFLFGPRATGKSSAISAQMPEAKVYDLLDDDVYQELLRRPKTIFEQVEDKNQIIVIDEIQKLPKLLDEVHRLIATEKLKFLLTGSSARKLKRGSANMLAGRALEAQLHPLVSHEIPDFDLLRYLNYGGLPEIYLSEEPRELLRGYTNTYLKEEIIAEGLTRNIGHFVRFLDVIALNNGEELHYQGISNDSGVLAKTVQNYIQILEDTLIGFQVLPFLKTKKRKAIARSKFYLFDLGVVNQIARRSEIVEGSELFGKAFEHFLGRELKSCLSYMRLDHDLCYWRSTSGFEVDFVVGRELAIEVKATKQIVEGHLKGLKALQEEGTIKRFLAVSNDATYRKIGNIEVFPWKLFLQKLWDGRLF